MDCSARAVDDAIACGRTRADGEPSETAEDVSETKAAGFRFLTTQKAGGKP